MVAGQQMNRVQVDAMITQLSVQLRQIMDQIKTQSTPIENLGTAGLEALPAGSNSAAQYTSAEATQALAAFGYLSNVAGCYYGTVQQGGTGGTGAILFNFDNELSQYWAGQ